MDKIEFINKVSNGNWDVTAKNDAVCISTLANTITATEPNLLVVGKNFSIDMSNAEITKTDDGYSFEAGGMIFTFTESIF